MCAMGWPPALGMMRLSMGGYLTVEDTFRITRATIMQESMSRDQGVRRDTEYSAYFAS